MKKMIDNRGSIFIKHRKKRFDQWTNKFEKNLIFEKKKDRYYLNRTSFIRS